MTIDIAGYTAAEILQALKAAQERDNARTADEFNQALAAAFNSAADTYDTLAEAATTHENQDH